MTVAAPTEALTTFLIRLADDNLVVAQRLGEWISNAADVEEDIALGNIALDHLGVARSLYRYAADVLADGRTEDDLAFLRTEREFTNHVLCEQPNGDFAHTMARQLYLDVHQSLLWERLAGHVDQRLAGIAAKAAKETAYHHRHSSGWVVRLGDGTDESRRRMQAGIDALWIHTGSLLAADHIDELFLGDTTAMPSAWRASVASTLAAATLQMPDAAPARLDGRNGLHSEHLGHLLAEMQWMQRAHPGLQW